MVPVVIRRLGAADVDLFRELRLESLREAPTAFMTDHADEARMPRDEFIARLERELVLGAERSRRLVGIVGLQWQDGPKHAHRGSVWGLYVVPDCRRNGISRQLMEALEAEAAKDLEVLDLEVVHDNEPARRLYQQLGYTVYGIQRKALKIEGAYHDRLLMSKELMPAGLRGNPSAAG
jgi:ribosomal protein S18 acetylase RimI-like enzyme